MRRWLAAPAVALVALLAACGDDVKSTAETEGEEVVSDLDQAVEVARFSAPSTLGDEIVAGLIADLCSAAGSGDAAAVAASLQASGLQDDEVPAALDAVAAGANTYCPDDVDQVVPQVAQALAPTTTMAPAADAAASSGGGSSTTGPSSSASSSSSGSSASGSSSSGTNSGGSANTSSGSADVGGGDATGTGNSSSTGMHQGVGSTNNSSSANGSSSTTG